MAYIENNSTDIPLGAFQKFIGKSFKPSLDYVTIAISLNIPTSGTLQVLHSFNDIDYFTFGDEYSYTAGSHSHQFSVKANFFKVSFENGSIAQSTFNLNTRILKVISEDFVLNKDFDTITVFPPGTGFLSSEHDSITIPTLDACITGVANDSLKVFVVNQSGGSASNVQIFDSNGASLLSDGDGKLQVSGSFDVGLTNYALENDGHLESIDGKLDIIQGLTFLNNKLVVDTGITGYSTNAKLDEIKTTINDKHLNSTTDSVTVNVISGFATSALQTTANTKLDDIKSAIDNKHLDSTTDSVTVNLITGFATSALQTSANTKLDTINTTITNKHLSSETDSVGVTGSVNILNYPSVQDVLITNTEPISVTGLNVVIPSSITVSNFPVSFEVSNFPTSTEVSNFPTSFEISSLPSIDVSSIVPITITAMPHLNSATDSVTVNVISGFATETKQDTMIDELIKVVDKTGDITAEIPYSQGAQVWANTTPIPVVDPNSNSGWLYQNASAGNAMNLYYFNGLNEPKTLNQVVGQFAIVSNLSTVLNDKLIFGIYTKGSLFYTTRITHSPPSGVDMVAGGKYLLYWGAVPEDIFPNLPRLNFSYVTTTGPAVPTEEILSVTLNSDSGATAGSVVISIESLGVVFSDGSENQSRVYNLISDNTEYQSLINIHDTIVNINGKINTTDGGINSYIVNTTAIPVSLSGGLDINNFPATQNTFITNDEFTPVPVSLSGGIDVNNTVDVLITNVEPVSISGLVDVNNQITNYALEADGNLEEIRNKTDSLTFNDNSGVLELNVFDIQNYGKLDTIETYTSKLDGLTYDGSSNLNVNIASGSITFPSGLTILNFPTSTNSRTQDASGNNVSSTDLLSGKRGLDTASSLFAYTGGTTRTALTCDIAGKLMISSYTADGLGNEITSTTTSTSTNSLDTASSLYVSNGTTTRTALTATGSSLNTNITNSQLGITGSVNVLNNSLDVHCYASSNGTNWHHLSSDSNGQLNIHSKTQDGAGTDITSTLNGAKQSLDVNVSNTVPVSGTFFQSTQPVSLKDGSDNPLTSTDTTATQRSLDTASCLYTTDASTRNALTSTAISSIRALDVNVANTSVPVTFSNTSIEISGTATVSDTTSQGYLNTINNGIGERPASFALGNLINNGSLPAGNFSTEQTFTKGFYGRNTLLFYRDSNISNTGSISVYSSTTSGTPSNVLLGTFYPISNGTFRQFTGTFNLLPFASLFIRNDSDSTITSVYVSYVNG